MKLDPDERHAVHAERIRELTCGEISGKEFVQSLIDQVGFSKIEAREQWQALKDQHVIMIYELAKSGIMVEYPVAINHIETMYFRGRIVSLYGSGIGATVQAEKASAMLTLPFSLFELRLAK